MQFEMTEDLLWISHSFLYGDFYGVTSYGIHLPYHEQRE